MTKQFNIDEVRTIINSVPAHAHDTSNGPEYIDKAELVKRFEEAKG